MMLGHALKTISCMLGGHPESFRSVSRQPWLASDTFGIDRVNPSVRFAEFMPAKSANAGLIANRFRTSWASLKANNLALINVFSTHWRNGYCQGCADHRKYQAQAKPSDGIATFRTGNRSPHDRDRQMSDQNNHLPNISFDFGACPVAAHSNGKSA